VTFAPRFAEFDISVIHVSEGANSGQAYLPHQTHLTTRQSHLGKIAFFSEQLGGAASGADDLSTPAFLQFDVVNERSDRDIGNRKAIASADFRVRSRHQGVADFQLDGR
jgi:hypothetical protein